MRNDELRAWRRRVHLAQHIADLVATGRPVWMKENTRGVELYGPPLDNGLGLVLYDLARGSSFFSVRYRLIGELDPDVDIY